MHSFAVWHSDSSIFLMVKTIKTGVSCGMSCKNGTPTKPTQNYKFAFRLEHSMQMVGHTQKVAQPLSALRIGHALEKQHFTDPTHPPGTELNVKMVSQAGREGEGKVQKEAEQKNKRHTPDDPPRGSAD